MTVPVLLIPAFWLLFVTYWGIMALGAKPTIGRHAWRRQGAIRVVIIALVVVALHLPRVRHAFRAARIGAAGFAPALTAPGVVLCAAGLGFAVWARVHLGRNWGMPMTRKETPELVTSGPYAFVRHPIYAGILLAMLGSVLGESLLWAVPLIVTGAYFFYSARHEEALMLAQFPQRYPEYVRRTWMLVPLLF